MRTCKEKAYGENNQLLMTQQLTIFKGDKDISDEIELTNGKANPFGWSQHKIMYGNEFVGWLESGKPMDFTEGFSFTITDEPNV